LPAIAGVLLTALIGGPTMAQNPPPGPPPRGPIDQQMLQLNPDQSKKFTAFENASRAKKHKLIDEIHDLRRQIWTLYQSYNLDAKKAKDLNRKLNHVQREVLDLQLDEQVQLRKILTPAQFGRLQSSLRQWWNAGHNNDRHHGDHGDHGHSDWSH